MSGETPAPAPASGPAPGQKDWMVTLLLSIFLGGWGVDRFYLGYTGLGIAKLAVTICTCGIGGIVWWIYDIVQIATMKMVDATGQPLLKK
jgi:TM2 domain-containing membrane protein YozV